jgi:hypothetical protein
MIPAGKKGVGDNGYGGEGGLISTPNSQDGRMLREFKKRCRARQETVNTRIKSFRCLKDTWRHPINKHKIAFEAVCVICQYEMENGADLFDV